MQPEGEVSISLNDFIIKMTNTLREFNDRFTRMENKIDYFA
jgi:hypothetical protein